MKNHDFETQCDSVLEQAKSIEKGWKSPKKIRLMKKYPSPIRPYNHYHRMKGFFTNRSPNKPPYNNCPKFLGKTKCPRCGGRKIKQSRFVDNINFKGDGCGAKHSLCVKCGYCQWDMWTDL